MLGFKPATGGTSLDRAFRRHIMAPVAAIVFAALGIAFAAAYWVGGEQNAAEAASSARFLERLKDQRVDRLSTQAADYTAWDEAVDHLHLTVDRDWADANVGSYIFDTFGFEMTFVISPSGETVYGEIKGERVDVDARTTLGATLAPALAASRTAPPEHSVRSTFLLTSYGPAFAALATVRPLEAPLVAPAGEVTTLIFVDLLDEAAVGELSVAAEVEGLRIAVGSALPGEVAVPLAVTPGEVASVLTGRPKRPGDALRTHLMPLLAGLAAVVAVFTAVSLRRVRAAAEDLAISEARARHLALHDPLTGLANRAAFAERLADTLATAAGSRRAAGLLCLDLDGFKEVNDSLGHPAGDAVLRTVAARLLATVREGDLVARLGGDEFAVLQADGAQPAAAESLARRLLKAVSEPVTLEGQTVEVGLSVGVALAPEHGRTAEKLLQRADMALYEAKAGGRRTYRFFDVTMNDHLLERQRRMAELRVAIASDQLEVFFQPQHALADGQLVGAEALVRWNHPERGRIPPAEFIPLAEESGLVVPLGEWVLRRACATFLRRDGLRLAVNLSPIHFRHADLPDRVDAILKATGFPADRLELEITETALFADPERASDNVARLRALGIAIAMDDFGTGYSSLSQISRFPVDTLKIDRSFVAGMSAHGTARAIIRAILSLAAELGVNVVAEGIETQEQLDELRRLGCADGQGYHFGRPMTLQDLTRYLGSRDRHGASSTRSFDLPSILESAAPEPAIS